MHLQTYLKKIPRRRLLSLLAKKMGINLWLVGGFLRNLYFCQQVSPFSPRGGKRAYHSPERKNIDYDFCVEDKTGAFAKKFAKKISSKCIVLDEKRKVFRVILKRKRTCYTYDFTALRGKNLYEDLSLRDFSINTLAVNLNAEVPKLTDYFKGRRDLAERKIRAVRGEVFSHDPLRILRGFSFAANYRFRIEKKTEKAMVKFKKLLKNVSPERINEELFKIFSSPVSFAAIKKIDALRIIDEVIPYLDTARGVGQGGYHHLDVWAHSLETLREFESLCRKKLAGDRNIWRYLNEELAQGRKRIQLIKLACLLHDIGKPFAKKERNKKTIFYTHEKIGQQLADKISLRLRLSLRERDFLKNLIYWHLRPGYLADAATPSPRAVYRFLRDTKDEGVAVIILSLSDWRATRGPLTDSRKRRRHEKVMFKLIDNYFKEKGKKPFPKIIDGFWLMKKFNLSPSPLIGEILKKVREEQALSRVSTKRDVYRIARKMIDRKRPKAKG